MSKTFSWIKPVVIGAVSVAVPVTLLIYSFTSKKKKRDRVNRMYDTQEVMFEL